MRLLRRCCLIILCFCMGTEALSLRLSGEVSVATHSPTPLSQRVVAYDIEAKLDAQKKTIEATETLTYRNLTGKPQDTFPFHLYLNGFQPKSTFMQEERRDRSSFRWEEKYRASAEITRLEVVGMGDLTSKIKFASPDDGNTDDRTVFQVTLPKPLAAGGTVQFKIQFRDQLGEVFARTGYKNDFIMGAQWFPKIGVWWQGAWNCHQFHSTTEFFADFGTYDVRLTVPQDQVVGATGVEVANVNQPDGTKTLTFRAEDVHDFAWTASPRFREFTDVFNGSMGPVKIRALMQPEHVSQGERHLRITKQTMDHFDRWYGPYPYKEITVVDPPSNAFRAGGMEYPTLITGDTTWFMPEGIRAPELVVEHEFGHQYWYGMVATNEFEDAWLDEGINSYTECKILDEILGADRSVLSLWGISEGDDGFQRDGYLDVADRDPMVRFAYQYVNGNSYAGITYGKTATVLLTLEKVIGEGTLRRALQTYFMRYRFTHPTKEDFLKTVEEVSGQNLRWYFDQAVYGTAILDYEILRAASSRLEWQQRNPPEEKKGETMYRTQVIVHRKGDFIFPVDLIVKFDNGEVLREQWDGRDRWKRYLYDKRAKIVSAEIDSENAVQLDKGFFNNSYVEQEDTRAASKLARYWAAMVQFMAQLAAWLV